MLEELTTKYERGTDRTHLVLSNGAYFLKKDLQRFHRRSYTS